MVIMVYKFDMLLPTDEWIGPCRGCFFRIILLCIPLAVCLSEIFKNKIYVINDKGDMNVADSQSDSRKRWKITTSFLALVHICSIWSDQVSLDIDVTNTPK